MAKRQRAAAAVDSVTASKTFAAAAGDKLVEVLSKAEEKAVAEARRLTAGIAEQYAGFRQKVSEIAPKVIGTFNNMAAAREAGKFSLAAFARLLDPTVPMNARPNKSSDEGYTTHKTYMALDYMRRSIAPKRQRDPQQGAYNGANKRFERTLATVLSLASTVEERDALWTIFFDEFGIKDRARVTLQKRVNDTKPFADLSRFANKIDISKVKPIHMDGADDPKAGTVAAGSEAEAVAAAGNKRRKSA